MWYKKKRILYMILFNVLLVSCGSDHVLGPGEPIPNDIHIILNRGGCILDCPIYSVEIFSDGKVIFTGKDNVLHKGSVNSSIPIDILRNIVNEFYRLDYFGFDDRYTAAERKICQDYATDHAIIFTQLTNMGKTKSVSHDQGCKGFKNEQDLVYLEDLIDKSVNTKQWVGP